MSRRTLCCALIAGACALCVAATAHASGIALPAVGTSGSNELQADAAAVYYNPAQLGRIEQGELLVDVGAVLGAARYRRERRAQYQYADSFDFALPVAPTDIDPDRTGYEEQVEAHPASAAGDLFIAAPLGQGRWSGGLGVYAPFGAVLELPADGAQRFQVQQATILSLYVTPAAAYRVSDRVHVGASVSYVLGFAELSRVQDFAALGDVGDALRNEPIGQANDFGPDAPAAVRELDVMARPTQLRRMWSHGATASAGLAWQASDRVGLAAAYRHGVAMRFRGVAEIDMNDPFFTQDLASQGLAYDPLITGDATLSFDLPGTVATGVRVDISDRVALDVTTAWVRWSVVKRFDAQVTSPQLAQPEVGLPDTSTFTLERDWRDAVEVETVTRWATSQRLATWLLLGYHSPATPDDTMDLASIDGHRLIAGGGLELALSARWAVGADVQWQRMFDRTVVTSRDDVGNGTYGLSLLSLGIHAVFAL